MTIFNTKKSSFIALAIAVLLVLVLPQFVTSVRQSSGMQPDWGATLGWLKSAECARTTGALLVGCDNGILVPYADIVLADDIGHALLLGIYSLLTGATVTLENVSVLNTLINYTGIVLVIGLLIQLNLKGAAITSLIALPMMEATYHSLSPHPATMGAALLSAILPLSILGLTSINAPRKSWCLWLIAGLIGLALANLLRQSVGMMGTVASVAAIITMCFVARQNGKKIALYAGLTLAVIAMSFTGDVILRARDVIYHLPPARFIEGHGIWHNLYIGLGVVPNNIGILWSDEFGLKAAQRVDPNVLYVSDNYYRILKAEYFRTVLEHPLDVLWIYIKKGWIVLNNSVPLPIPLWPMNLTILGVVMCVWWTRRDLLKFRVKCSASDALAVVAAFYVMLFIAQGTLIHPGPQYFFPAGAFVILGVAVSVENVLRRLNAVLQSQKESTAII